MYHNQDGPAYQNWYENGQMQSQSFWIHGKLHNENGSANQEWNKDGQLICESYFINGKMHNAKAAAFIGYHELTGKITHKEYWFHDKRFKTLKKLQHFARMSCLI